VYFSRIVLPVASVGSIGFNWLFEMAVLLVALTIAGAWVLPWIPLMLVTMVLLAIFATGVALMLSVANVHFRDTQYFMGILLQIWMYLTPIVYPINLIIQRSVEFGPILGTNITIAQLYRLNPMERFVEVFRALLYDNRWPELNDFLYCVIWAFVSLVIGVIVFRRNEKGLAEAL
jgi:lipopolysaccharide transport system permease protein